MKRLLQRMLQKLTAFRQHKSSIRPNILANRKRLTAGFTLIELLVAALIASLMVGIMLSFLIGVLDSDRKETAKSNAQEELQAAISYISDDLQEAVYIYGSEALAGINSQLPHTQTQNTAGNECNPTVATTCTPVLVFWKRNVYAPTSTATYSKPATGTDKIGCMPYKDVGTNLAKTNCNASTSPYGGDRYTYSLVAYYLKNDAVDSSISTSTWSKTARILRWELKDGYAAFCYNGSAIDVDTTNCPQTWTTRVPNATSSLILIGTTNLVDTTKYFIAPSPGFNRPDFVSSGTLSSLSGAWKKFDYFRFAQDTTNPTYPFSPFVTLVDLIDDTAYTTTQDGNSAATGNGTSTIATAPIKIPIGKNNTGVVASPTNFDCDNPSIGVGNPNPASSTNTAGSVTQRIPDDFSSLTSNPAQLSSFYACVTPESITARIYIRGNALARLGSPPITRSLRPATNNNITFFPTANVRAFGRSAIGIKTK